MTRRRRILIGLASVLAGLTGYLTLWPVDVDPEAWRPAPSPGFTGVWAENHDLAGAEWLARDLPGPECIAFDAQGNLLTGTVDGRILRVRPDGTGAVEIAHTGGRPLGLEVGGDGRIYVADADRGLLRIGTDGSVETLAAEEGGRRMRFVDDLAIARDGTIYFSDASTRRGLAQYKDEAIEHRPNGRVLVRHPDGRLDVLAAGLYFANGVALAPDESYLLVAETTSYRVQRIWLDGARRGQREVFIDNLPGFPDNITWSHERRAFWVAIGPPRDATLDALAPRPFLRKMVARLPAALQPRIKRHAMVFAVDEQGRVVANLQHRAGDSYSPVASVIEHGGFLYLGSFQRAGYARIAAPAR